MTGIRSLNGGVVVRSITTVLSRPNGISVLTNPNDVNVYLIHVAWPTGHALLGHDLPRLQKVH